MILSTARNTPPRRRPLPYGAARTRPCGPITSGLLWWAIAAGWLLGASPAPACTIPVYCYALEHWTADPYQLLVFHRGLFGEQRQALTAPLAEWSSRPDSAANCILETVDASAPLDPSRREVWNHLPAPQAPWLVLRAPVGVSVWDGPLNTVSVAQVLDSPMRTELAGRLLAGDAGVWILLESGREEEDTGAARVLDAAVSRANRGSVPAGAADEGAGAGDGRPGPTFSVLRLSRTDPEEQILVQMLLHSEPDLLASVEAMAFPVFGRGRALYALVGKGINEANVREACSFISGECSCQIKELNPGTDLLMSVDWDRRLSEPGGDPCAAAAAEAAQIQAGRAGGASAPGRESGVNTESDGVLDVLWETGLGRNLLLVLLAGLGIIGIAAVFLARRR